MVAKTEAKTADRVELLLKEYDALRAEVIHALSARLQVWSYGSAALGVAIGGALAADAGRHREAGWFMFIVVPMLSVAVFHTWMSETRRVRRASYHLWGIEHYIGAIVGERLLRWEHDLRHSPREQSRLFREHYVTTMLWFATVAAFSAFQGAQEVLCDRTWCWLSWLSAGIVFAVFLAIFFSVRFDQWDEADRAWPARADDIRI